MSRILLSIGVVLAALYTLHPAAAQDACDSPVRDFTAVPDEAFDARWALRDGAGWTGGDGAFSIVLPDGRSVWTYGDTFLGDVDETDTRVREGFSMIRNSVVVQDGDTMTTLRGQTTDGAPDSYITPEQPDTWYWPMDGLVQGETLYLFWQRYASPSGDAWDLVAQGIDVQTLSLPNLTPVSLTPLEPRSTSNDIAWGTEFLTTDTHTYIYGIEGQPMIKLAHVARFPADGDLFGAWEYFDGAGWSADPDASVSIAQVSNSLSVFAADGHYVLMSFTPAPFSSRMIVYEACDPAGPWTDGVVIYDAPEADQKRIVYFPIAHPQFFDDSGWLFSYSMNTHNFDGQCEGLFACHLEPGGAANYRPRFVRVTPLE